jgi:ATP-dependent Clp protease ATP-binding subunit ClpC
VVTAQEAEHRTAISLQRIGVGERGQLAERLETAELAEVIANNALTIMVGDRGAGVSTLLELVAAYVGDPEPSTIRSIPRSLRGRVLFRTSVPELQAGATYVNELEGRLIRIAEFVATGDDAAPAHGVLCIEDVHVAGTAGATGVDPVGTVANILLPLIANGLRVVGTTTPSGLNLLAATAPEFVRRSRIFRLPPASEKDTIRLLKDANRRRGTPWRAIAIAEAVDLCSRLLRNRCFPGKAFDLLREAESYTTAPVGASEIVSATAALTGLRRVMVDTALPLSCEAARKALEEKVLGQSEAIDAVTRALLRLKSGLADNGRPVASLLFVGQSGVGKTALARAAALFAFGSEDALLRWDMSEYGDYDAASRFLGFDRRSPGFPDAAAARPFSIVLLDEIEKATAGVLRLLLQLLGEGRLTGASGITADFSASIVILTSNTASDLFGRRSAGFNASGQVIPSRSELDRALATRFPPELVNRLQVVVFRPLEQATVTEIARREVSAIAAAPAFKSRRIGFSLAPELWERLASEGYDPLLGARPMARAVERLVRDPLAATLAAAPELRDGQLLIQENGAVLTSIAPSGSPKSPSIESTNASRAEGSAAKGARLSLF